MHRHQLNDRIVRGAQPVAGRAVTMKSDGAGLWLMINKHGGKHWLFRYMIQRRKRTMGLGPYPEVTLAEAREKHAVARKLTKLGLDPLAEILPSTPETMRFKEVFASKSELTIAKETLAQLRMLLRSPRERKYHSEVNQLLYDLQIL